MPTEPSTRAAEGKGRRPSSFSRFCLGLLARTMRPMRAAKRKIHGAALAALLQMVVTSWPAAAKAGPAAGAAGSGSPLLAAVDVGLGAGQHLDVGAAGTAAGVELALEAPRSWTYLGDLQRFREDSILRHEISDNWLFRLCPEPSLRLKTRVRGYQLFRGGNKAVKISLIPYAARDCEPSRTAGPVRGVFVTADPLGYVDGPSMYAFAGFDPVNYGDPLGLERMAGCAFQTGKAGEICRQARDGAAEASKDPDNQSFGASLVPGVGDVKDVQECATGQDLIAKKDLTTGEQVVTCIAVAAPYVVTGALIRSGWKALTGGADEAVEAADEVADAARRQSDVSTEGPYAFFNETHSGSAPSPKGRGPSGGLLQSHHGLQNKWAQENLSEFGYDPSLAPTVTIETGRGHAHTTISNLQNARARQRVTDGKGKWSSTLQEELGYIVDDFRAAGFEDEIIEALLEQQYQMLDKLGVSYQRVSF